MMGSNRRLSQQTIKEKANLLLDFIYSNHIGQDCYLRKDFVSECNKIIGNVNVGPIIVQKMIEKGLMNLRNSQFIKGQKVIVWSSPIKPNLPALIIVINESYEKIRNSKRKYNKGGIENEMRHDQCKSEVINQVEVVLSVVEKDPIEQLNYDLILIKNKYQSILDANITIEVKVVKTKELTV